MSCVFNITHELKMRAHQCEFTKRVLQDAKIALLPSLGFGEYGDGQVRFALIENEARTHQAVRGITDMFRKDGLLVKAA